MRADALKYVCLVSGVVVVQRVPVIADTMMCRTAEYGQEQTYSANKKLCPKGRGSANHGLINPLGLYIVYAPFWNLPATFPYCCPSTVLEWKAEHDLVLPPVVISESIIFHVPALRL